jgi:TnpA family transposase
VRKRTFTQRRTGTKKHEILSPQSRAALFDPPTDPGLIVRHYMFSPEDIALIRRRRRAANRLGFAVNLAYLRFRGRAFGAEEAPPADMLAFIPSRLSASRQTSAFTLKVVKRVGSTSASFKPIWTFARSVATTSAPSFMSRSTKRPDRIAATSSCPR